MRDEYLIGEESFSQIALRYGTNAKLVEQHALDRRANGGSTWGELRKEFRFAASRSLLRDTAALATENAGLRIAITNSALKRLQVLISRGAMSTDALIQAAKLGIDPRLEITGHIAGPIEHKIDLGEIKPEVHAAIAKSIETLLHPSSRAQHSNGKPPSVRQEVT